MPARRLDFDEEISCPPVDAAVAESARKPLDTMAFASTLPAFETSPSALKAVRDAWPSEAPLLGAAVQVPKADNSPRQGGPYPDGATKSPTRTPGQGSANEHVSLTTPAVLAAESSPSNASRPQSRAGSDAPDDTKSTALVPKQPHGHKTATSIPPALLALPRPVVAAAMRQRAAQAPQPDSAAERHARVAKRQWLEQAKLLQQRVALLSRDLLPAALLAEHEFAEAAAPVLADLAASSAARSEEAASLGAARRRAVELTAQFASLLAHVGAGGEYLSQLGAAMEGAEAQLASARARHVSALAQLSTEEREAQAEVDALTRRVDAWEDDTKGGAERAGAERSCAERAGVTAGATPGATAGALASPATASSRRVASRVPCRVPCRVREWRPSGSPSPAASPASCGAADVADGDACDVRSAVEQIDEELAALGGISLIVFWML